MAARKNHTELYEQVSFVIKHKVKPEAHERYEDWLRRTIAEAAKFHGHMGAQVARPAPGHHEYEIAVRFATRNDAEQWIDSDVRKELVKELNALIEEPERLDVRSGIDYWFTSVTEGNRPPKRWKQWLTSVSVIWPLTLVIPWALRPLFHAVPFLGRYGVSQLVVAMCVVAMVVYVVMPPYARLLAKWLSR